MRNFKIGISKTKIFVTLILKYRITYEKKYCTLLTAL